MCHGKCAMPGLRYRHAHIRIVRIVISIAHIIMNAIRKCTKIKN